MRAIPVLLSILLAFFLSSPEALSREQPPVAEEESVVSYEADLRKDADIVTDKVSQLGQRVSTMEGQRETFLYFLGLIGGVAAAFGFVFRYLIDITTKLSALKAVCEERHPQPGATSGTAT